MHLLTCPHWFIKDHAIRHNKEKSQKDLSWDFRTLCLDFKPSNAMFATGKPSSAGFATGKSAYAGFWRRKNLGAGGAAQDLTAPESGGRGLGQPCASPLGNCSTVRLAPPEFFVSEIQKQPQNGEVLLDGFDFWVHEMA